MASRKVAHDEEWGTKEVADYIGMSRQWVQIAAVGGVIPSFRLSERGRLHFKKSQIEEWYAHRLSGARAAS